MDISSILKRVGNKKGKNGQKLATIKQKIATKHLLEKGGSVGAAMRVAKYSEATIKNPEHLTKSKGYLAILDKAGLTDEFLAKGHHELARASTLREYAFSTTPVKELIEIDEDHPKWDKKGRGKQFVEETNNIHISDEMIASIINKISGAELIHIVTGYDKKTAYYQVPEHQARKAAHEMAYKAKGLYAPEKIDLVDYTLTDEEKETLDSIADDKESIEDE